MILADGFGSDFGRRFRKTVLEDDFGRRFWKTILADDFGRRFWQTILADESVDYQLTILFVLCWIIMCKIITVVKIRSVYGT